MITTFYPPYSFGGDAIYVHRLCSELAARGHEVDVIHCADSYYLFNKRVSNPGFSRNPGVTQHKLRSRYGALSPFLSHQTGQPLLKSRRIEQVLAAKRFHVIHFHNISLFGPGVLCIEPSYAALKLYTAHDHWLVCPTNVLWKNGEHACDKPTCVSCCLRSHRPPQWWRHTRLLQEASAHVDRFLAPSQFCLEMHRRRGFDGPMEVLPELVPVTQRPVAGPRVHDRPYYLFVGRLEKLKGVQELLPHFAGDGPYDLLIAGAGGFEQALRRQAAGLQRVRFLGWIGQDEIGRYYRDALAALVPSLTYETFGIVLIEALAQGTPVVVNDLGALPEVVAQTGGGLVYRNGAELRAHLDTLAANAETREALGRAGRQAVFERYRPEMHLGNYEALISRLWRAKFAEPLDMSMPPAEPACEDLRERAALDR
jgi:glycosyltransferase involved in cell wall biosynthesis